MVLATSELKKHTPDFEPLGGLPRSQYGPKEGWLTFVIVLLLVLSVVWSVETAHWLDGMPSYSMTAIIAVLTGMLLAKVKTRAIFLHSLSALMAYVLMVWQTRYLTPDGWFIAKTGDMIDRFQIWVTAAESGGISADPLPFVIIVFIFTWIVTYIASWFVFRSLRFWPAVIPAGLALFLNLLYLPEKFWVFFYMFILMVILLSMRMYFLRKRAAWDRKEVPYVRGISPAFGFTTLLLAGVMMLSVVLVPRTDFGPDVMKKGWSVMSIPWKAMETELGRVLSFLPAQIPYTIHKFGDAFPFRGASNLGEHVVMRISADQPAYWRAETFEVYTPRGWLTGERVDLNEAFLPGEDEEIAVYSGTELIEQSVEMGVSSDAIFAGANPLHASRRFEIEIAPPLTFEIDLSAPTDFEAFPEELRPVARAIRADAERGTLTFTSALEAMPEDTIIQEIERDGSRASKVILSRKPPNPPDITALRPNRDLNPEDTYTAISYTSTASEEALREAGTDYPSWVTDRYLQLTDDLPQRVHGLAEGLTDNRDNPYDKAIAIRNWLRVIPFYTTDIEAPPQDVDGIDYFLFETKRGYSSYFSSSMVVMLRSVGIPSRLAVGYSTGGWDEETSRYVVISANAHSWPEAYFPDYGWIAFEPVPQNDVIIRGGFIKGDEEEGIEDVARLMQGGDPPGLGQEDFGTVGRLSLGPIPGWGIVATGAVIAAVGLIFLSIIVWLGYGLRKVGYTAQVYGKMTRMARLAGHGPRATDTPREFALNLAVAMDSVDGHIEQIGESYGARSYRSTPLTESERASLAGAWDELRRPLFIWSIKRRLTGWRNKE